MSKLFDADGFKTILQRKAEVLRLGRPDNEYGLFLERVAKMVDLLPGVDAAPVRHGQWVSVDEDVVFACNKCGAEISTSWDYDQDEMWAYCPCCGARMDEDVIDDGEEGI